jgi:single-strand DNA-binding protein
MASFNKVILMGNLTRDPEIRQAGTGVKVADLGLAVTESWRDKSGQTKEVTCFVDVVVWDKLAELCGQYLTKCRPVLVEGRLQMDEWKNQQGEKRSKLRVRAETVKFLGTKPAGAPAQAGAPAHTAVAPTTGHADAPEAFASEGGLPQDDENLPF